MKIGGPKPERIYLSPAKAQPKLGLGRAGRGKTRPNYKHRPYEQRLHRAFTRDNDDDDGDDEDIDNEWPLAMAPQVAWLVGLAYGTNALALVHAWRRAVQ